MKRSHSSITSSVSSSSLEGTSAVVDLSEADTQISAVDLQKKVESLFEVVTDSSKGTINVKCL